MKAGQHDKRDRREQPMNALDLFRLDGKTAIITGGGRGLGRYMARLGWQSDSPVLRAQRVIGRAEESPQRAPRPHGRAALRSRRGRRKARPYPARSPKTETLQRAIDVLGDRSARRSEQREFEHRRVSFTCESRNRLPKQLRLAAPALPGEPRQCPLELERKIHRGLRHTLYLPYVMTPWGGTEALSRQGAIGPSETSAHTWAQPFPHARYVLHVYDTYKCRKN